MHIIKGNINDDIRENLDAAIGEYKKALKIDSEDWTIWYNLGVSYGRKGEADLAISIYKKVIKLNPNFAPAFYNRGVQQMVKGNFNLACDDWQKSQKHFAPARKNIRLATFARYIQIRIRYVLIV